LKILFVYPNVGTELRIPLAISILIAKLRSLGHEVRLFDPTFLGEFRTDNEQMALLGTHRSTNLNQLVGECERVSPREKLQLIINDYLPDFIFVSLVERNFNTAKDLLKDVDVPVLAGGIMPTIATGFCKSQDWIDYVCVGEGENGMGFLDNPSDICPNPVNMDEVPEQDWTDFDERHLLKPFMGSVYRGGAFEFSRGCFGACAFCVAPRLRERGIVHRTKSPKGLVVEIENKVSQYGLQMVAFSDTDFLRGVKNKTMSEFLKLYAKRINLPFTMQASVYTLLDEEILELLKKAKCCAISVGVESGSPKIQKSVLKKPIPREAVKKAFNLCRRNGLRVTANYMMGLPFETEEDIRETFVLNMYANPHSIAVTYFTPFMGTELYDICVKHGFYRPFKENVYEYPPLDMPQLSQDRIKELVKEFSDDFKSYQEDICPVM
jgi:radical SAM superfamily enzyme YgiQ (UPF0313 family)